MAVVDRIEHARGVVNTPATNGRAYHPASSSIGEPSAGPAETATYGLPMRTLTRVLSILTEHHLEFVDVTDQVTECLTESGLHDGFAVVFSRHTTAGIRINEHEPLLLEDLARMLEQVAPVDAAYRHDDFSVRTVNLTENERVNGHAHCRSLLLGASESVPVVGGRLLLGRWQRIFLVELDGTRQREIIIQFVGA